MLSLITLAAIAKNPPAPVLDGTRPLAAALKKAGWEATPEGSDRYKAGTVYDGRNGIWAPDCFAATPSESIYNELEVLQALKAGAKNLSQNLR